MQKLKTINYFILSLSVLILSISAFIFAFNYGKPDAKAVGVYKESQQTFPFIFTQSTDGKTLYLWEYDSKNKWSYSSYNQKGE